MREWIESRRVLAAFSDPAGAKVVLAFLFRHGMAARSITIVSDRVHSFYEEFGLPVRCHDGRPASDWLQEVDVLVTGTSVPVRLELDLINAAAGAHVPSYAFVDHWTNFAARFERSGRRILPDGVGVIDAIARDAAMAEGLPIGRLHITGNPHHEYLRAWRPRVSRAELLASLGLNAAAKFVLYAPEPLSRFGLKEKYGFDEVDGIRQLHRALADCGVPVIIKAHPNQDHETLESYLATRPGQRMIYLRDADLATLSYYAEVVVGFFSNSLLEARVLGRPVVRMLVGLKAGVADPLAHFSAPDFIACFNGDDLERILIRLMGRA